MFVWNYTLGLMIGLFLILTLRAFAAYLLRRQDGARPINGDNHLPLS